MLEKQIISLHFLILDNAIQLCASISNRINNFQIGKKMSLQSGATHVQNWQQGSDAEPGTRTLQNQNLTIWGSFFAEI